MPSLSISTSWEVENPGGQGGTSHFKRTMVHMEVDAMVEKLRPRSDKNRKLIFRSIASFFDGETEVCKRDGSRQRSDLVGEHL